MPGSASTRVSEVPSVNKVDVFPGIVRGLEPNEALAGETPMVSIAGTVAVRFLYPVTRNDAFITYAPVLCAERGQDLYG